MNILKILIYILVKFSLKIKNEIKLRAGIEFSQKKNSLANIVHRRKREESETRERKSLPDFSKKKNKQLMIFCGFHCNISTT